MKLRLKLFTAFLITAVLIVVLLAGIMQVFVYRNFAEFVNRQELEALNDLVSSIAEEYREAKGWEPFIKNSMHWKTILDKTFPSDRDSLGHDPSLPLPFLRGTDRHHQINPPTAHHFLDNRPPHQITQGELKVLNKKMRLNLFDRDKRLITGPAYPENRLVFREIRVTGEIVGWVGLYVDSQINNPLGLNFLAAQKKAVYSLCCGILLLAACISYLLSKHLISPIQELMKGTRAMASFHFNTEINVRSNDELGMLASDFNHMARTLNYYEEMRKQWVSDISHELRTPITILKGKIESLQDGVRKMTPETLDSLHRNVTRLGNLVEDLHFLSLSDSESLQIKKEPVFPLALLQETLDSFQERLEKQAIRIQADLSRCSELTIDADKNQLYRLYANLVENTLRYTDSPGTLKLSYEIDHTWFTLVYEDSPPGVPDDRLMMIFSRLYRVDQSRSRELGGSGLGLSICKQIVENHKGTIRSGHSALGGLEISIRLPVGRHNR